MNKAKWKINSGWSACSTSCYSASTKSFKSRKVECYYEENKINKKYCDILAPALLKPSDWEMCKSAEMTPCQPQWILSEWGPCSVSCGRGILIRKIDCPPGADCNGLQRPETTKVCDLGSCVARSCKDIQRLRKTNLNGNYYIQVPVYIRHNHS